MQESPGTSFLPDIATKLYEAMTDPERGTCQPGLTLLDL